MIDLNVATALNNTLDEVSSIAQRLLDELVDGNITDLRGYLSTLTDDMYRTTDAEDFRDALLTLAAYASTLAVVNDRAEAKAHIEALTNGH